MHRIIFKKVNTYIRNPQMSRYTSVHLLKKTKKLKRKDKLKKKKKIAMFSIIFIMVQNK